MHNVGIGTDILFFNAEGRWLETYSFAGQYLTGFAGGGDGFVSGLLYGLLKGWDAGDCLRFGWATGALAVTMLEDFATPADEAQVWDVWKGNARVKR